MHTESTAGKKAILLLNLGSPKSPAPHDVRAYLKEFLNDPYVIDIPQPWRSLLVNGVILNTRPKKTSAAYQKIWTAQGSPLILHTHSLAKKVQEHAHMPVYFTMRYGTPSIRETLTEIKKAAIQDLYFIPLYPQYSYAATESSFVEFEKQKNQLIPNVKVIAVEDFFNDAAFIDALAESIKPTWERTQADLLLLSYHGIPERQIAKTKYPPAQCCSPGCCDQWSSKNEKCYRAQCYETSRLLAEKLKLKSTQYSVAFQSRLGRTKWIEPYTDFVLQDLPNQGIKRLLVASPSFTADCLETLEEIQIRYAEVFKAAGGEFFEYIPCLNSADSFAKGLYALTQSPRAKRL